MFQFNFEVSDEKDGGHVCDQDESQKNDVEASSSTQTKPNGNNGRSKEGNIWWNDHLLQLRAKKRVALKKFKGNIIAENYKAFRKAESAYKRALRDAKMAVFPELAKIHIRWLDAEEVPFPADFNQYMDKCRANALNKKVKNVKLRYLKPDFAIQQGILKEQSAPGNELSTQGNNNVQVAEKGHSDLVPGIYEGGAKIWECTHDLLNYMAYNFDEDEWPLNKVLDLGCGSGLIGLFAFLRGSMVDFHDYNKEVIQRVTMANLLLNDSLLERGLKKALSQPEQKKGGTRNNRNFFEDLRNRVKFYAGDWRKWVNLTIDDCAVYDIIFTSETIYNPKNQRKLLDCLYKKLKPNGLVLLAAGVGGDLREFEKLMDEDERFVYKTVWSSQKGIQREILELRKSGPQSTEANQ